MKQYKNALIQLHTLPKHPHNCQTNHTLQNPYIRTPTRYKTHTYTHPHITKQFKTPTVQDTHQIK